MLFENIIYIILVLKRIHLLILAVSPNSIDRMRKHSDLTVLNDAGNSLMMRLRLFTVIWPSFMAAISLKLLISYLYIRLSFGVVLPSL